MAAGSPRNERDKTGPKPPTPAELQAQAQEASRTQQYEDALAAGEVDMVRRGRSNAGQPQPISQEQFTAQRVADMQGAAMTRNPSNEFGYIDPNARRFDAGFQANQRAIRDDYGVQQGEFSDARISNIIDPEQNYILTQEERAALEGIGGIPTDPFTPPGGGGGGISGVDSAYENYFANQEKYAQEKFDSISGYLDELQISSDQGFAEDMNRISGMYDQRRDARNQRFADALNRAGGRESAAIDTLAELGIQADANTFDPVTGETRDMLFSQQMSGADMLNSMSYITDTIYDFAKNEQDLAIGAGLENAQQNLLAEMAAIQMARDSKAISDAEAAAAAASAANEAANLHQYYITMGQSIGMSPEVSVAYGELGMLGDAYGTATEPVDEQFNVDLGFGPMPMTMDQLIDAGGFAPEEGGISFMMGGQPVPLPYNANFQDIMLFAQQQGIPIEPIAIPGQ